MVTDLRKLKVPDSEIIETCLPSYLLVTAFDVINKAGKRHIPQEWVDILNTASISPLTGMDTPRVKRLAQTLDQVARLVAKESSAESGSEYATGVAMCIIALVKDGKIPDPKIQGVLVSTRFVEEALDFQDVCNLKAAKRIAGMCRNSLNRQGYYL